MTKRKTTRRPTTSAKNRSKQVKPTSRRGEKGRRFVKGQSGNPKGRPKGTLNLSTKNGKAFWTALLEDETVKASLIKRLRSPGCPPQLLTIASYYAFGKPATQVDLNLNFDHKEYLALFAEKHGLER